ncbi:sigma 54-interacting response regulator [Mucilaginibacter celer]|uniref:Response regulator n=1 Tax=Mucilaginibacter celer TaxID=2305508 RepID=A0A494VSE8_9SPHI|nr:sigma 54-interacting response regulator [Mucilaginibacter celer]AYL94308.1 response regulator [Mucilaginibacter celer]
MKESILIVEDQFIEANDLRSTLEMEGYLVCGIARSVARALELIRSKAPDIVIIDILLQGAPTGIDLAKQLMSQNMPFIYLSANSNNSTFNEAKKTQPDGFLVKPFRKKDVLIALEIATYRSRYKRELLQRHATWLNGLLSEVYEKEVPAEEKLKLMLKAFQPLIPFELLLVDLNSLSEPLLGFKRVSFDEYEAIDLHGSSPLAGSVRDMNEFRQPYLTGQQIYYRNGEDFLERSRNGKIINQIVSDFDIKSELTVRMPGIRDTAGGVCFYSSLADSFSNEHAKLIISVLPELTLLVGQIQEFFLKTKPKVRPSVKDDLSVLKQLTSRIVGKSPKLLFALDQAVQVAQHDTSVLVLGETGAGKEGIVNIIHHLSPRKNKPFVKINCAAIQETLVESELFGHEKGAFTGAFERRIGKFEQAQGGTIFLDEIGELPLDIQSKLLRVIQEKEIERLGGHQTIKTDVRIVAATNRNLDKEVALGFFRIDLYYRLNVFPIMVPALRERKEDIPALAEFFLKEQAKLSGQPEKKLDPVMMAKFVEYSWPGNIRELKHLIERFAIMSKGTVISRLEIPVIKEGTATVIVSAPAKEFQSIDEIEKTHIMAAIKNCKGKIAGAGGAAEVLKIPVTTLRYKMKKLGIGWHYFHDDPQ